MSNSNLARAKRAKNDEFYTLLTDVERELARYTADEAHGGTPAGNQFRGAVVYCNCDDPRWSAFYEYFATNFEALGLAGLIATHHSPTAAYKVEISSPADAQQARAHLRSHSLPPSLTTRLDGDGDYRDGAPTKKFGNIKWFTNLAVGRTPPAPAPLPTTDAAPTALATYDNYDAVEVSRVGDIPAGYSGIMGVPVTFLSVWAPRCGWDIIWQASGNTRASAPADVLDELGYRRHQSDRGGCCVLGGRRLYTRLFIRRTPPATTPALPAAA